MDIDDGGDGIFKAGGEIYYTLEAAKRVAETVPGWRLPTKAEVDALLEAPNAQAASEGSNRLDCDPLRTVHGWLPQSQWDESGTDSLGFHAKPTGFFYTPDGKRSDVSGMTLFWVADGGTFTISVWRNMGHGYESPQYLLFPKGAFVVRPVRG